MSKRKNLNIVLLVVVFDVPFTFPSRLKDGIEIKNWGSHGLLGSFDCNRADLALEVFRRFGDHQMGYEIPLRKFRGQLERIRRGLTEGAKLKGMFPLWLTKTMNCELFITVFSECHRGGTHFLARAWR